MLDYIIKKAIEQEAYTREEFYQIESEAAKKFDKSGFPKDTELLETYKRLLREGEIEKASKLKDLLITSKTRSLSGIVPITCLTEPSGCPGECLYCPKADEMPKSYLRGEPAAERAYLSDFDPYKQMEARINSLQKTGHPTDKIELIILGATWSFYSDKYKWWFIANCFAAANKRKKISGDFALARLKEKLKKEKEINEEAKNRIIGLTVETRPDWVSKEEIKKMRTLGVTRVELGVQTVYDQILEKNNRGHNTQASKKATKLLKEAGLKINYHIMLNLPGSSLKKDEKIFEILFNDPGYQPDWLKIYPCVVLEDAPLYKLWKEGEYEPYSTEELKELLIKIKKDIPPYVRITRLIRDIPSQAIVAGATTPNLRETVQKEMKERGLNCDCIRCREIREKNKKDKKAKFIRREYEASGGKEIFLSYEDKKQENLYALLRLRIPAQKKDHFIDSLKGAAIVRELHTYGAEVPIEGSKKDASQHKGLGKSLMKKAEEITKEEFGLSKLAVISGVGVRGYYKKLGYNLKQEYMIKELT